MLIGYLDRGREPFQSSDGVFTMHGAYDSRALRELIEAKVSGKQIVTAPEEEKPAVDIMTALKQSIERTKAQKKPMEKAKGEKKEAVEAAPAAPARPKKQKVA